MYTYLKLGKDKSYLVKNHSDLYIEADIINMFDWQHALVGGRVIQQVAVILITTNCAPFLTNLLKTIFVWSRLHAWTSDENIRK